MGAGGEELRGLLSVIAIGVVLLSAGSGGSLSVAAGAAQPSPRLVRPVATDGLDSRLTALVRADSGNRAPAARVAVARAHQLDVVGSSATVIVEKSDERAATAITQAGGAVTGRAGDLLEARLPIGALERVAAAPGVARVRAPALHSALATPSSGPAKLGADRWHAAASTARE